MPTKPTKLTGYKAKGDAMKLTNQKDNAIVPIMHGENWLQPIDKMPEGKTTIHDVYIAGHSETGHHHVLKSKAGIEVLEQGTDRYVLIKDVAELFHKKTYDIHETILVQPGAYKITHKTEYDPFQKIVRQVWD